MEDEDNKNHISMKSVKFSIFMGSHVEFQTWWFQFEVFATMWKFSIAVGKVPEVDIQSSESASCVMNAEL